MPSLHPHTAPSFVTPHLCSINLLPPINGSARPSTIKPIQNIGAREPDTILVMLAMPAASFLTLANSIKRAKISSATKIV